MSDLTICLQYEGAERCQGVQSDCAAYQAIANDIGSNFIGQLHESLLRPFSDPNLKGNHCWCLRLSYLQAKRQPSGFPHS